MVVRQPDPQGGGEAGCFVCTKHRRDVGVPADAIHQDDLIYVGHALPRNESATAYLGYLIVETRRHAPGLADLSPDEARAVGAWVTRMARALTEEVGAEHVYAFVLGHDVKHFHEHVVPRYPGAPREYWGTRVAHWPDAPRGDAAAIAALCDRLRLRLAQQVGDL